MSPGDKCGGPRVRRVSRRQAPTVGGVVAPVSSITSFLLALPALVACLYAAGLLLVGSWVVLVVVGLSALPGRSPRARWAAARRVALADRASYASL
jgi:hypothetical protein